MKKPSLIMTVLLLVPAGPGRADVVVGPYVFGSTALVDDVVQVAGPAWDAGTNGWLDGLDSHPFAYSLAQLLASQWDGIIMLGTVDVPEGMVFEALFTDNVVVNGPGVDIVLFDAAEPSSYAIAISTPGGYSHWRAYADPVKDIGVESPYWRWGGSGGGLYWLEAWPVEIDLSDFGLAEGDVATAFRFAGEDGADPLGAAALNSGSPLATRESTWGAVKALYR